MEQCIILNNDEVIEALTAYTKQFDISIPTDSVMSFNEDSALVISIDSKVEPTKAKPKKKRKRRTKAEIEAAKKELEIEEAEPEEETLPETEEEEEETIPEEESIDDDEDLFG